MSRKLLLKLSRLSFIKVMAATPAPRWLVLIADLAIVVLSCVFVFLFNTTLSGEGIFYTPIAKTIIVFLLGKLFSLKCF